MHIYGLYLGTKYEVCMCYTLLEMTILCFFNQLQEVDRIDFPWLNMATSVLLDAILLSNMATSVLLDLILVHLGNVAVMLIFE